MCEQIKDSIESILNGAGTDSWEVFTGIYMSVNRYKYDWRVEVVLSNGKSKSDSRFEYFNKKFETPTSVREFIDRSILNPTIPHSLGIKLERSVNDLILYSDNIAKLSDVLEKTWPNFRECVPFGGFYKTVLEQFKEKMISYPDLSL